MTKAMVAAPPRFGSSSAHGVANLIRFNYFLERGAFVRDEATGTYADPEQHGCRMNEAAREPIVERRSFGFTKRVEVGGSVKCPLEPAGFGQHTEQRHRSTVADGQRADSLYCRRAVVERSEQDVLETAHGTCLSPPGGGPPGMHGSSAKSWWCASVSQSGCGLKPIGRHH